MKKRNRKQLLFFLQAIIIGFVSISMPVNAKYNLVNTEPAAGSYTGDVILAANMNMDISSAEDLAEMQNTGITNASLGISDYSRQENGKNITLENRVQTTGEASNTHMQRPCMSLQLAKKYRNKETKVNLSSVQQEKQTTYHIGDLKSIATSSGYGNVTGEAVFTAEAVYIGEHCTIWRDASHPEQLSQEKAREYALVVDKQIFEKEEACFGSFKKADVDGDGKFACIFYESPDSFYGFFYAADLFDKAEDEYATDNQMDMIHLNLYSSYDVKPTDQTIYTTLAHELQHLINFAETGNKSEGWLDETFSEAAQAVTGLSNNESVYEAAFFLDYIAELGFSTPFIFNAAYVPSDTAYYGNWFLFGRYLAYQTIGYPGGGNQIYKTILNALKSETKENTKSCTRESLITALTKMKYLGNGCTAADFDELIMNYNTALYLREDSGIYSLNNGNSAPSVVDNVDIPVFNATSTAIPYIPGGGACCYVKINGSFTPVAQDENIRYSAVVENVPENVTFATDRSEDYLYLGDTITLSCTDKNTTIFYTTDGSDPLKNGVEYKQPLTAEKNMTLKAISIASNDKHSDEITKEYRVQPADVVTDIPAGEVAAGTKVTLTCPTKGAAIYYTTDGLEPSKTDNHLYRGPISLTQDTTIKAISVMPGNESIDTGNSKVFHYQISDCEKPKDRYEPNNSLSGATAVNFPTVMKGTIHSPADVDVFSFRLTNKEPLSLLLTPPNGASYSLTLLDETGRVLITSSLMDMSQNIRYMAGSGNYYVQVESLKGSCNQEQNYTISLQREAVSGVAAKLDLSEMNMLTAMTDTTNSKIAWQLGLSTGGHHLMATSYYSSWLGPVDESEDIYNDADESFSYKNLSAKALYHVQTALYLPTDSREECINAIKNAVYNYGSVYCGVMMSHAYFTPDEKNLYVDKTDWKYKTVYDGGHAVSIVGWDDSYSRDNFTGNPAFAEACGYETVSIPKPKENGAFIVKNSWGEESGDTGYFYLSYEDIFWTLNSPAVYLADELPDNYNSQYVNDIFGLNNGFSYDGAFMMSEVFTVASKAEEQLKAVSFQTTSSNTNYEIFVRTGEQTIKVAEGSKKYAGFYTERLSKSLILPAGSDFEILVRVENTNGQKASLGVGMNSDGEIQGLKEQKGRAFLYIGNTRQDMSEKGIYPTIRAYTNSKDSKEYNVVLAEGNKAVEEISKVEENKQYALKKINNKEQQLPAASSLESGICDGVIYQDLPASGGSMAVSFPYSGGITTDITSLPEIFDLRTIEAVTPVRNQGNAPSCWTFAATCCVETSILRNNGNAIDYPKAISLSDASLAIEIENEQEQKAINLCACLEGSQSPSTTGINWSVTGDVDSIRLNNTSSFSGESLPILTALKEGTVTVTAASDADMNIMASCTITITDKSKEKASQNFRSGSEESTDKEGTKRKAPQTGDTMLKRCYLLICFILIAGFQIISFKKETE